MWEKLLPYPTLSLTARTSCSPWRGRSHSYSSTGRSFLYFRQSTVPQDGRRHHQGQHKRRLRAAAHPLRDGWVREGVAVSPLSLYYWDNLAMEPSHGPEVTNSDEKSS